MPTACDEAAEERRGRAVIRQVERLRVVYAREFDDRLARHRVCARLAKRSDRQILEIWSVFHRSAGLVGWSPEFRGVLFENDVVILAGGTGRVGGATLRTLHDQGARLAVASRRRESAEQLCAGFPNAIPMVADLADSQSADTLVADTLKQFGRIDAIVNMAGRGKFVPIVDSTTDDLRLNLDGFVITAYNLALAGLRAMLRQDYRDGRRSRGHIVTVTAGSSKDPQPRFGLFGAAKAAVNTLMRGIAREHKGDGIVANAVVLGGVATEAARSYLDAQDFAKAASPDEVARVLAFLASSASDGINGELIDLNARETE